MKRNICKTNKKIHVVQRNKAEDDIATMQMRIQTSNMLKVMGQRIYAIFNKQ